ncbi:MAG: polysaccharide export protein [Acidobacteriaceae bacterium]|nr:polysaccharide export protein [Acidobacteriaceae bacterium]
MAITTNRIGVAGKRASLPSPIRWTVSLCVAVLLAGLGTQAGLAQQSNPPAAVIPFGPNMTDAGQIVLGAGDLIDVTVFSTPELTGRLRIDQAGKIELPVGGHVEVGGLTPKQAAAAIEKQLRDQQIMLEPLVSVLIAQYATQGLTLLGEVKAPGNYPIFGPHTLYDVMAMAGGPTQLEGSTITITHHNDPAHPVVVQVSTPNYSEIQRTTPVYPGDTVVVSQSDVIYVVGDVTVPGALPMPNGRNLTLLNVLALVRGMTPTAAVSKAVIIRQTTAGVQTIPIDIKGAMKNTAPNPILLASDVLVIPDSGFKKFLQFALPSLTNAAVNAAVISGTR